MKKRLSQALSIFLCICMLASFMPAAFADEAAEPQTAENAELQSEDSAYYSVTSKKTYAISPGVTETRIVLNNSSGTDQNICHVLEADLKTPNLMAMPSYKDMKLDTWDTPIAEKDWGEQVMSKQVAAAEAQGINVVGATNVNLSWADDHPLGMLVINGKVYYEDTNYSGNYLVFDREGNVSIRPGSQPLDGSEWQAISGWGYVVKDGVSSFPDEDHSVGSRAPRTCIGIKADGSLVMMVNDGRQAPITAGMSMNEVATMMISLGCVDVIGCDGGGSSTFISKREGSDKATLKNSPSDGIERPTLTGLMLVSTAKPSGEFDHAAISPSNEIYTPGTEIQFSANGVDSGGCVVDMPEGLSYALSEESAALGSIDAKTGLFKAGSGEGIVTVQMMKGKDVVGSAEIEIAKPDAIYFGTDEMSLGFSASTEFNLFVRNKNRDINYKVGDLLWSMSNEKLGTFEGNTFTSSDGDSLSGVITVTSAFDSSITASINLIVGKLPTLVMDFEDYTDPDTGEVIPAKEYYTIGKNASDGRFYTSNYNRGGVQSAEIVSIDDDEPVRFGSHALKLNYDFTNCGAVTEGACFGSSEGMAIPGMPTAIGVWVYAPEGVGIQWQGDGTDAGFWLRGYVADGSGGNQAYDFTFEPKAFGENPDAWPDEYPGVWWEGWRYLEADLTKLTGPFQIKPGMTFRLMYVYGTKMGTKSAGSLYFDNLQFVYGANIDDTDNPIINSIRANEVELLDDAVIETNDVTFETDVYDVVNKYTTGIDTVRMYIDGINTFENENYNFKADPDGSKAYLYNVKLSAGEHSLTVTVRDKGGNETSATRYFTVKSAEAVKPIVSVSAVEESAILNKTLDVVIRATDAGLKSANVSLELSKLFPDYTVSFGEKFEGTSTYKSFTRTLAIEAALKEGESSVADDVIATVRFSVPTTLKESDEFTYAAKSVEYALADGTITTFSAKRASIPVAAMYSVETGPVIVGASTALKVVDNKGTAVAGISLYLVDDTENGKLLGVTDESGKLMTDELSAKAGTYVVFAKDEEGNVSFNCSVISYENQTAEDGKPYGIMMNAPGCSGTQKNISWFSDAAGVDAQSIKYAPAGTEDWTTVEAKSELRTFVSGKNAAAMVNSVTLSDLKPGVSYDYTVGSGDKWSDIRSFKTSSGSSFFVLGDIQAKDLTNITAIMNNIKAAGYNYGIQTGDAVDDASNYSHWMDIVGLFGTDNLGSAEMLHVLGNHEYAGDGVGGAAAAIYNMPTKGAGSYYSVSRGDVYIAVINYTGTKAQLRDALEWLKADAAQTSCTWKVLCMHQPAYYTNVGGGNAEINELVPAAVDEAGIDIVFSGHDHSYARTEPLKGGQVDENGAVYFICGSSGEKSYSTTVNPDFHFVKASQEYNAIYLTVNATSKNIFVTAYDVDSAGNATVYDSYAMGVPVCEDEHDYDYDSETDELICKVCAHSEKAKDIKYSGWATDLKTGRNRYFAGGSYVTGVLILGDDTYAIDQDGLVYQGVYDICGEKCEFDNGKYVRCTTADLLDAGLCGQTAYFALYSNGNLVVSGNGAMSDTSAKRTVWEFNKQRIKHVTIGKDITAIGKFNLFGCTKLESVSFEEGSRLQKIGWGAFGYSNLPNITIPDSVTRLESYAFYFCSKLTEVNISENSKLTSMGAYVFKADTKLTRLYIPDAVTLIGADIFLDAGNNVTLSVAADSYAQAYAEKYGIAYEKRTRPPQELASGACGENAEWVLTSDGVLTISGSGAMSDNAPNQAPWEAYKHQFKHIVFGKDITYIGKFNFFGCGKLESVSFEEGTQLERIGWGAFGYSGLPSIVIPDSVTRIDGYAFYYCSKLSEVTITKDSKLSALGEYVFKADTKLTSLYIPDGVTSIGTNIFLDAGNNVTLSVAADSYAQDYAERYGIAYVERELQIDAIASGVCGENAKWYLTSDGVLKITGRGAMSDNTPNKSPWEAYKHQFRQVEFGKGITYIGKFNFFGCGELESVSFAEGSKLERIGWGAFGYSGLRSIAIPDSVTRIDGYAFYYCSKLSEVTISENSALTSMGEYIFKADTKLTSLYIPDGVTSIGTNIFLDAGNNVTLSVAAYSYAQSYAERYGIAYVEREVPITVIASGDCGENATWSLTSDGVLTIGGSGAMSDNNPNKSPWEAYKHQFRQVVFGKDITYIGKFNFFGCGKLDSVSFEAGSKLERIGWGAFGYSGLRSIAIPDSVTRIDGYAFYYCSKLSEVTISENSALTSMGEYIFKADTKLTSLYIPDGVTSIGTNIFLDAGNNVTLSVAAYSYAQSYAERYGIAYVEREVPITVIASGDCGENATWSLTSDGVLTIGGSGAMSDNNPNKSPWEAYKHQFRQVVFGKDITYIGKFNFFGCGELEGVSFEEGTQLERIGWGAFGYSGLRSIVIPDSVTRIDGYAFYYCSKLSEVTISENSALTSMGEYIFKADTKLTSLYIPDGVTSIGANIFLDADKNVRLSVAANSYAQDYAEKYGIEYDARNAEGGTEETPEQPEETPETPAANFCGAELTWKLEDKVLTISGRGEMTSYGPETPAPWAEFAAEIEHIVIGKDVEKIGAYAFKGLEKLLTLSFEDESKLTNIEEYAFADCKELSEVVLPDKLEKLGEAAFANCKKLAKLVLPEALVEFEIITIKPETPELDVPREPVDVFDGCDMSILVLVVKHDSAAEKYALDHSITVQYDEPEPEEGGDAQEGEDNGEVGGSDGAEGGSESGEGAEIIITPEEPEPAPVEPSPSPVETEPEE